VGKPLTNPRLLAEELARRRMVCKLYTMRLGFLSKRYTVPPFQGPIAVAMSRAKGACVRNSHVSLIILRRVPCLFLARHLYTVCQKLSPSGRKFSPVER